MPTAPVLTSPNDGTVDVVPEAPGQFYHPIHIWRSTLPGAEVERYELSRCPTCVFEVVEQRLPGQTYGGGFAEVALDMEQISGEYRWRVRAVYPDGTELLSETWRYLVYAFEPITVTGIVTDESTGEPIAGARLRLVSGPADWRRSTNLEGGFAFEPGPGGPETPTLTVTKEGYQSLSSTLVRGLSVSLDLELTPVGP